MNCTRRTFIKSGLLITAGLPLLQGCEQGSNRKVRDELFEHFRHPAGTSKPFVRWWWNGDKLQAGEILRELDVLKEVGIGGVEINPIAFPGGDDMGIPSMTWLSPEWVEMVKVALKGAEERGLVCDIIVGSGWPFGGEFLLPEEQTQVLARVGRAVKGPARLRFRTADFLKEATPQIGNGFRPEGVLSELHDVCLAPAEMRVFAPAQAVPFDKNSPDVFVDVPEGEHILYALVKYTGFQRVINGAPGAAGPVLNHYNREAVEKYLNNMSNHLFPAIRGLKGFRSLFCDSMELDGANWCHDFPEEFKRRKGYDLTPYLPFLLFKIGETGLAVEDGAATIVTGAAKEEIGRVRHDFSVCCMEVMRDRFLKPYTQWSNRHGFKSRVQAYGRSYHPLEGSLEVDIPECETWLLTDGERNIDLARLPSYRNVNKFVASAVHLSGKKIVSCEEITNVDTTFNTTLEQVKAVGDQSNLSGVTHSILHGFNYSPPEAPFPGWVRYGTFFSERNPWWPFFKSWAAYKARLSTIFQETDCFADIAVMHPLADLWTLYGPQDDPRPEHYYPEYQYRLWEAIHRNGNSCDYISEHILQQSKSRNGFLTYGTRKYHTLLLMDVESIEPATAEALAAFTAAGGRLIFIGREPHRSPGWHDHRRRDEKVRQTIEAMKQRRPAKLFTIDAPAAGDLTAWFGGLQQQCGIEPYLHIETPDPYVSQIRHRTEERDFLFIVNSSLDRRITTGVRFAEAGSRTPFLWDAETGERYPYPSVKGQTLTVDLYPATSQLIVFENSAAEGTATVTVAPPAEVPGLDGWNIRMEHINGGQETRKASLFDLAGDPQTRPFAGHIYYTRNVDDADARQYLDLGRVHGVSEVTVNGEPLGCRWYGRHLYRLPEHIAHVARKTIEVKVTTTTGNYLKSSPENPYQYYTQWQRWPPVGMTGPVRLL